jgi:hypothetical protein
MQHRIAQHSAARTDGIIHSVNSAMCEPSQCDLGFGIELRKQVCIVHHAIARCAPAGLLIHCRPFRCALIIGCGCCGICIARAGVGAESCSVYILRAGGPLLYVSAGTGAHSKQASEQTTLRCAAWGGGGRFCLREQQCTTLQQLANR